MSTSIIYHGFRAVNYGHLKTEFREGNVFFHIRKRERRCCACGSCRVIGKGVRRRQIQTLPIGLKRVFFEVENRPLLCRDCGALRYESLGIADPRRHHAGALERYTCV